MVGKDQRCEFTVGLMLRRQFRRLLRSQGLAFTEDKGWLDSQFIVTGPSDKIYRVVSFAQDFAEA